MRVIVDYLLMNIHHVSNALTTFLNLSMGFLTSTRQKLREKSRKNEINSMYHKHSISIDNVEALPDIDAAL